MEKKVKKILLAGGGTAGSVTPLLAIADSFKEKGIFELLFVGTSKGIERTMVKEASLNYQAIIAGKWRRYFSWHNFFDLFKIFLAFWQALVIIMTYRPDLILSAGSFVAVPVVLAGWLCRVPVFVHQQDVRPGLANKLMAPFARVVTVTFEKSLADYGKKAVWTGNPNQISNIKYQISKEDALKTFSLKSDYQTVFIVGGGTGAEGINKLIEEGLDNLVSFCQIIHSTGKDKMNPKRHENYHLYEFLNREQMTAALAAADIVVSRAGISSLTELSLAAKPAIIIPMPDSHQEDNAAMLLEKNAAIVLNQKTLTADELVITIRELLKNESRRAELGRNINGVMKNGANKEMATVINNFFNLKFENNL